MKHIIAILLASIAFVAVSMTALARADGPPPPVPQICQSRDCTPPPPVSHSPARNREYRLVCKHPGFRHPICQLVVAAPPALPQY